MSFNISSTSSANSVWSLLASRAASTSKTDNSYSSTSSGATSGTTRADGPPPPPSQFSCSMSTEQFAGMGGMPPMGPPPGGDPIASLDADDSGSVSADEFGLSEDSDDKMKALFSAIDADGSGNLSTDEIDGFREKMMASDGGHAPGSPPETAQAMPDVSAFLKQLADRYASLASTSETASTVSATA